MKYLLKHIIPILRKNSQKRARKKRKEKLVDFLKLIVRFYLYLTTFVCYIIFNMMSDGLILRQVNIKKTNYVNYTFRRRMYT